MIDRSSIGSLRATLVAGGRTYKGWQTVSMPDHDLPSGTYVSADGKGTVATFGTVRQGGDYVFAKKFNKREFAELRALANPSASATFHVVDADERILASVGKTTGGVKGITSSPVDTASGDALMMMVRYTADGAIG